MTRSNTLVKIVVGISLVAGLGYLFVRSAIDTQSEPYSIDVRHLRDWTLAIEPTSGPTAPILVLRPPSGLGGDLFRQVFARSGESLSGPAEVSVPLMLQGEFDRSFAGDLRPDDLLAAAKKAGLESAVLKPRCLGHRRVSAPGSTRQVYFVVLDAPWFGQFREQIRDIDGPRDDFDPTALSPTLIVAASDAAFSRWLPLADPETDCIAPIVTAAS